jgi:hypothetical protein
MSRISPGGGGVLLGLLLWLVTGCGGTNALDPYRAKPASRGSASSSTSTSSTSSGAPFIVLVPTTSAHLNWGVIARRSGRGTINVITPYSATHTAYALSVLSRLTSTHFEGWGGVTCRVFTRSGTEKFRVLPIFPFRGHTPAYFRFTLRGACARHHLTQIHAVVRVKGQIQKAVTVVIRGR